MLGLQERDVHDHHGTRRGKPIPAGQHLDADGRVGDGVEVGQGRGVGEGDGGQVRPVDPAALVEDGRPETVDEGQVGGTSGLDDLTGHLVGVDQHRAALDEKGGDGRLARADPPGQPDHDHGVSGPGAQAAGRGREAVAKRTMVVRSSASVTKKSSAVIPDAPPASPRAINL